MTTRSHSCDEDSWLTDRLGDGDYTCSAETIAFRAACPGIWFAPM